MLIKGRLDADRDPRARAATDVPEHLADGAALALAPDALPLRKVSFKAGKKDSVASVAARYRVSAQQVARVEPDHAERDVQGRAEGRRLHPGQGQAGPGGCGEPDRRFGHPGHPLI